MKLQVTQENLAKALQTVARVASTRSTLPVLANVLLKTANNQLSIAATNLDIAITCTIGAKIQQEGEITVPARLFQDFISSIQADIVTLSLEDLKLHINTDRHSSTINGAASEDFPTMPSPSGKEKWKLKPDLLLGALQQIAVAASNDEARPVLTGVLLHTVNGELYAVATDSYRLAEKSLMKHNSKTSLLIPVSAVMDLLRVADDANDIEVEYDEQQVLFRTGTVEIVSRLIDGTYPDYKKLIPSKFATTATLSKSELASVTKVSSLFARESAGSVQLHIDEESQELSIHSIASQVGENTSTASAEVTGSGTITLNSRYILDALNVLHGDKVQIAFNGKLDPCMFTDPEAKEYIHVIMPLKS